LMAAFYMFRLISMTFLGAYRGPAWESGHGASAKLAAEHGAPHPVDPHAHGQAHKDDHEVSHGPAEPHSSAGSGQADDAHGHGHGPWHGPHESPAAMTYPLMALAIGAIVAGFFGVPSALWGNNAIEKFLEPSFTAEHVVASASIEPGAAPAEPAAAHAEEHHEETHLSTGTELGLMGFSVVLAMTGIFVAYRFY